MTGRLQFWLQRREWWPACWLGNRISDLRYWLWRAFDGSWPTSTCLCDRFKGNVSFDRTICACGSMHHYCRDCGWQTDPCEPESTITIDPRYASASSNQWRYGEGRFFPDEQNTGKGQDGLNVSATINHSALRHGESPSRYASGMDREKFVTKQAKGWDSPEEFLKFHDVSPCECGKRKCKGWQVRWKFGAERRREGNT